MKLRRSLFWDVDPAAIDLKKNARYVIERVLDFGTDNEVRWMWKTYPKNLIRQVAERSRTLRPETHALWHALTK